MKNTKRSITISEGTYNIHVPSESFKRQLKSRLKSLLKRCNSLEVLSELSNISQAEIKDMIDGKFKPSAFNYYERVNSRLCLLGKWSKEHFAFYLEKKGNFEEVRKEIQVLINKHLLLSNSSNVARRLGISTTSLSDMKNGRWIRVSIPMQFDTLHVLREMKMMNHSNFQASINSILELPTLEERKNAWNRLLVNYLTHE